MKSNKPFSPTEVSFFRARGVMFKANSGPKILQKRPMRSFKLPRLRNRIPVRLSAFGCHRLRVQPEEIAVENAQSLPGLLDLPGRNPLIRFKVIQEAHDIRNRALPQGDAPQMSRKLLHPSLEPLDLHVRNASIAHTNSIFLPEIHHLSHFLLFENHVVIG